MTHVALVCTAYLICLQDMYTCDSVPFVFVSRETDANIIWFEFTILIFCL